MVSNSVEVGPSMFSTWTPLLDHSFGEDVPSTLEIYAKEGGPFAVRVTYTRAKSSGYSFRFSAQGACRVPIVGDAIRVEVLNRNATAQCLTGGLSEGILQPAAPLQWSTVLLGVGDTPRVLSLPPHADLLTLSLGDSTRAADVIVKAMTGVESGDEVVLIPVGMWRGDNLPPGGIPLQGVYQLTVEVTTGDDVDMISQVSLSI